MNALTIVDTDILIDAALQINKAIDCLDGLEQNSMLAISVITQMELFVGCRNKTELGNTKRFLQRFQVLKLSDQISDKAIGLLLQYRLSHGLAIPDALIAATAITFNQPFHLKEPTRLPLHQWITIIAISLTKKRNGVKSMFDPCC